MLDAERILLDGRLGRVNPWVERVFWYRVNA